MPVCQDDTATTVAGVRVRRLAAHADRRGSFQEIHRDAWSEGSLVQWNVVRTVRGGMRGVHLHLVHTDLYVVSWGVARVGLRDLRRDSPSFGTVLVLDVAAADAAAIRIPPGIAHGVLALEDCLIVVGVDRYFDPADDLGCRFDDPALGIDWGTCPPVILSERDAAAPRFAVLQARWDAAGG